MNSAAYEKPYPDQDKKLTQAGDGGVVRNNGNLSLTQRAYFA
jgi:hypothetical protein